MEDYLRHCKECGKWKDETDFYLKMHTVHGKRYANYETTCKDCKKGLNKLRRKGLIPVKKRVKKEEVKDMGDKILGCELTISETNYVCVKETKSNDEFIYANLKRWGNCLVNRNRVVNYEELEDRLGKRIKREITGNCYILEVY